MGFLGFPMVGFWFSVVWLASSLVVVNLLLGFGFPWYVSHRFSYVYSFIISISARPLVHLTNGFFYIEIGKIHILDLVIMSAQKKAPSVEEARRRNLVEDYSQCQKN